MKEYFESENNECDYFNNHDIIVTKGEPWFIFLMIYYLCGQDLSK